VIQVKKVSAKHVSFVQEEIGDLLGRRRAVSGVPGAQYQELASVRLYGHKAKARCLEDRQQKTLLMEVDPLTDEDIRHYFELQWRHYGWKLGRKVLMVRGTAGLTPAQRLDAVKDL
jgi:hypothetical protein